MNLKKLARKASDASTADCNSARVHLQLFSGLEILIKHRSWDNKWNQDGNVKNFNWTRTNGGTRMVCVCAATHTLLYKIEVYTMSISINKFNVNP